MSDKSALSATSDMEGLVERIASDRDKAAFRTVFHHYAPRLKSYLLGLGLPDQPAEDIVQEVMITLWRKADSFDPSRGRLSTWLFRIARNRFIDRTRKRKYPTVNADDHMHDMVAPEETDKPVHEAQTAERIHKAMSELKPGHREVIELSFFRELSHSKIADELNIPLGTVKSRIRHAFARLRSVLGEQS